MKWNLFLVIVTFLQVGDCTFYAVFPSLHFLAIQTKFMEQRSPSYVVEFSACKKPVFLACSYHRVKLSIQSVNYILSVNLPL